MLTFACSMQIEFGVCVDFTASNGAVHTPQSLHFLNSQIPNQYEMAIRAVLEICEHYNHRRIFDACGFGAKIPPDFNVAHHFPLVVRFCRLQSLSSNHSRTSKAINGKCWEFKACSMHTKAVSPTVSCTALQTLSHPSKNLHNELDCFLGTAAAIKFFSSSLVSSTIFNC